MFFLAKYFFSLGLVQSEVKCFNALYFNLWFSVCYQKINCRRVELERNLLRLSSLTCLCKQGQPELCQPGF